jgi:hypothetical protein
MNYKLASKKSTEINKGWRKPSKGILMINVDIGFDETKGVSIRAVVRDSAC